VVVVEVELVVEDDDIVAAGDEEGSLVGVVAVVVDGVLVLVAVAAVFVLGFDAVA